MAERVWEGDELTPEVVQAWGYDEELLLMSQDEDLLLYDFEFVPVLLELAADEHCPKQVYAFQILSQFCREEIVRGGAQGVAAVRAAWSAITAPSGGYPREWHQYVGRLLSYAQPAGPVNKQTAKHMAEELLLGVAGRVGLVVEGESLQPGWWRFTLQTSVTEHVDVQADTGAFSYVKHYGANKSVNVDGQSAITRHSLDYAPPER